LLLLSPSCHTDGLNVSCAFFLRLHHHNKLTQHPKATTGSVRSALIKEHKTWVIPERRLKKFVKRQQAGKPMTADDDKSTVSGLSGFFTNKSRSVEAAPKKKYTPKLSTGKPVTVPKKAKPEEPKVEPVPLPVVEKKLEEFNDKVAYADDNDGKKGGSFDVCEGCAIL
jgi:hypothetical protein